MSFRRARVPAPMARRSTVESRLFCRLFEMAHIDTTGKRKVDGSLAKTRLGKQMDNRWSNERFRQTMLLILEFRLLPSNTDLGLSSSDVEFVRVAHDVALAEASKAGHLGDIYDFSPTAWAI